MVAPVTESPEVTDLREECNTNDKLSLRLLSTGMDILSHRLSHAHTSTHAHAQNFQDFCRHHSC